MSSQPFQLQPQPGNKLQTIASLILLFQNLTQAAVALVHALAQKLDGKTDEEILNEADALFSGVIVKAQAEIARVQEGGG
jgi:hypothetical protein